jgi:hypothetical protein
MEPTDMVPFAVQFLWVHHLGAPSMDVTSIDPIVHGDQVIGCSTLYI